MRPIFAPLNPFPVIARKRDEMKTNTIGERIAECRRNKGLTQFDLAELLCTKKATISAYENDKIDIKISILKDIAKLLDTSVSYLSDGESEASSCEEVMALFNNIKDDKLRRVAIEQMRVLANM